MLCRALSFGVMSGPSAETLYKCGGLQLQAQKQVQTPVKCYRALLCHVEVWRLFTATLG